MKALAKRSTDVPLLACAVSVLLLAATRHDLYRPGVPDVAWLVREETRFLLASLPVALALSFAGRRVVMGCRGLPLGVFGVLLGPAAVVALALAGFVVALLVESASRRRWAFECAAASASALYLLVNLKGSLGALI